MPATGSIRIAVAGDEAVHTTRPVDRYTPGDVAVDVDHTRAVRPAAVRHGDP